MKEAIVVLGMHRSGTSSIAGALARLGACAPKTLMPDHPDNPKGYWESQRLVELSDRILLSGGSFWSDWRPFNMTWRESADGVALTKKLLPAIRAEFGGEPLIVCKDPRMCRIFPIWEAGLRAAGYQCKILSPLRSPTEVAASLYKRDGFPIAQGMMIWLRHVLDAEFATRHLPRRFVMWMDVLSDWRHHLLSATDALGVIMPRKSDLSAAELDVFLDAELRRQTRDAATATPGWIADAWTALQGLTVDPIDPDALAQLDRVREEFDAASATFGPVLVGLETEAASLRPLTQSLKDAGVDKERMRHELIGMTANRDEHAAQAAERGLKLAQLEARMARAETEVSCLSTSGHAAEERLAQVLDALNGMTSNRDDHARLAAARYVALETVTLQTNDLTERLSRAEVMMEMIRAENEALVKQRDATSDLLTGMTANRDEHQTIAAERLIALEKTELERAWQTAAVEAAQREIDRLNETLTQESIRRSSLEDAVAGASERESHLIERAAEEARMLVDLDMRLAEAVQSQERAEADRRRLESDFEIFRRRQLARPIRTSFKLLSARFAASRQPS